MRANHYGRSGGSESANHLNQAIPRERIDRSQRLVEDIQLASPRKDHTEVGLLQHTLRSLTDPHIQAKSQLAENAARHVSVEIIEDVLGERDRLFDRQEGVEE